MYASSCKRGMTLVHDAVMLHTGSTVAVASSDASVKLYNIASGQVSNTTALFYTLIHETNHISRLFCSVCLCGFDAVVQ